jgi:Hsp20/alpha crystallin family
MPNAPSGGSVPSTWAPAAASGARATAPSHGRRRPDPEGIDATLEDGVLTVRVPKPEQTRRRRVEVQAAQPS